MSEVKVKHVLADGRELDDIKGFVIPNSGICSTVYQIAAEITDRRLKECQNNGIAKHINAS